MTPMMHTEKPTQWARSDNDWDHIGGCQGNYAKKKGEELPIAIRRGPGFGPPTFIRHGAYLDHDHRGSAGLLAQGSRSDVSQLNYG